MCCGKVAVGEVDNRKTLIKRITLLVAFFLKNHTLSKVELWSRRNFVIRCNGTVDSLAAKDFAVLSLESPRVHHLVLTTVTQIGFAQHPI